MIRPRFTGRGCAWLFGCVNAVDEEHVEHVDVESRPVFGARTDWPQDGAMASNQMRTSRKRTSRKRTSEQFTAIDDDALTALDLVRARLSEIDALAAAADDRIDAIPGRITDRDQRRRLGQLFEFVAATAKATRDAVDEAERLAAAAMRTRTRTQ